MLTKWSRYLRVEGNLHEKRCKTPISPSEGGLKDIHLDKSPVPNSEITVVVGLEVSVGTKCEMRIHLKTSLFPLQPRLEGKTGLWN